MNSTQSPANLASEHRVRRAQSTETQAVCNILASAFAQDPVMQWMNQHPQIYASLFRAEAVPLYMKKGQVYINAAHTGAAMWVPPGVSHEAPLHWTLLPMLWNLFRTGGVQSLRRGTALEKIFKHHHIQGPHYYLHTLGAMQGNQGKGIGSALLREGLAVCDLHHAQAYLESSNIKNNALYERFGFRVTGEVVLPEGGPKVWLMLREAR